MNVLWNMFRRALLTFWSKRGHKSTGTCWLQNTRYSRKLRQEAPALTAGIDRSYISEVELAKSSVSLDILERLAVPSEAPANV